MCCMGKRMRTLIRATSAFFFALVREFFTFFFSRGGRRHLFFTSPPPHTPYQKNCSVAGIGIATPANDWRSFTTLNAALLEPNNFGPQPEVCLEAATPPVRLSTGDWLHLFAAGTQGWGPWGPGIGGTYSAGWVVLDRDDPGKVVQRSVVHPFVPDMDYERGTNPRFPVCRNNTLFVTSLVPIPGRVDAFRAWYGAADANVATAVVTVAMLS